jgi:hypothetical protein
MHTIPEVRTVKTTYNLTFINPESGDMTDALMLARDFITVKQAEHGEHGVEVWMMNSWNDERPGHELMLFWAINNPIV